MQPWAACLIPHVAAHGLDYPAPFPHLRLSPKLGDLQRVFPPGEPCPGARVSASGAGASRGRAQRPVLLTECVPGGTTTQAALTALGITAGSLISGSAPRPLRRSSDRWWRRPAPGGSAKTAFSFAVLAAVGDPSGPLQRACWWPPGSRFSWGW